MARKSNDSTNKYEYTMDQELADAAAYAPGRRCVCSPGGSTFQREMTPWPPSRKCDVKSKIRLRQLKIIYLWNIPAKNHPDPIWNDGSLGFLKKKKHEEKQEKNYKMSSDTVSVPDPKKWPGGSKPKVTKHGTELVFH